MDRLRAELHSALEAGAVSACPRLRTPVVESRARERVISTSPGVMAFGPNRVALFAALVIVGWQ